MRRDVVEPTSIVPQRAGGLEPWDSVVCGTRTVFGAGALEDLGRVAAAIGGRRALLVTDAGLRASGHVDRALHALAAAKIDTEVFDEVSSNPTSDDVERGARHAAEVGPDLIVALGGGSAMDCARGINFVLTNGGRMEDYRGYGRARAPMLPAIGVPTTAGTGSEAQTYAVIAHPGTREKMACGDPQARFRAVLLDPRLLPTAPRAVAATAGIDALSHAVESYVTRRRNPFSTLFAAEAFRLVDASLEPVLDGAANEETWGRLMLGAHFAGQAIEHSMLGAAHATANPLTASYGVVHGAAVGLMLPHVVRWNGRVAGGLYDRLAGTTPGVGAERLAARVEALLDRAGLPRRLRDHGIPAGALAELAEAAETQWTGTFNPVSLGRTEFEALYAAAY